jgi:hypothetical protein
MSEKKVKDIEVLFPEKSIDIGNGKALTVRPLTLKDLPKVISAFGRLVAIAEEKSENPEEIAFVAIDELTELIPFCVNASAEEIPLLHLPEVLSIIVDQNLNAAAVGKWKALVEKIPVSFKDRVKQALVEDQSNDSQT